MILKLKRTPGIYLVGFMGSGKSTVGRHLAHRLGWSFFDTDEEIEAAEKTTIAEIFATRGEPEFRRIETAIIRQHVRWIERGRPAVLALGGGAFSQSGQPRTCSRTTASRVWLDCPFETVQRRVGQATPPPAGARSRRPSPRSMQRAATTTAWPTSTSPSTATTPKSPSPPS